MARFCTEIAGRYVYLTVRGVEYRVYYEEAGEGTPVLFQHTAGSDGRQYRHMLEDPELKKFAGRVSDSGEGRWTINAAIDEGVPAHVLTAALFERFSSRGAADFADKLLSAMRYQFGGHVERKAGS